MDDASRLLADLFDTFKAIGFFDHLKDYEFDRLEREVKDYEEEITFNVLTLARDTVVDARNRDLGQLEDCKAVFYEMRILARGVFDFTGFTIRQVEQGGIGLPVIGFNFNGRRYEKHVYDLDSLIHIANRALVDATIDQEFWCAGNRWGILFLSTEQCKRLIEKSVFGFSEWGDKDRAWTSDRISSFLSHLTTDLQSVGLLAHLSEEQIAAAERHIASQEHFPAFEREDIDRLWLLRYYPGLTHAFDTEYLIDLSESAIVAAYTELVTGISSTSHGLFVPENLTVSTGPEQSPHDWEYITLSFEYGGRTYSYKLEHDGDFVDPRFMYMINQALDDAGQDGRFFFLDDWACVMPIFLTSEQLRLVKEKGFPPLAES